MGEPDVQGIHNETIKLRIEVKVTYQAEEGRRFEFTACASHSRGVFLFDSSATRST